jgi:DNA-binding transcriptional LysR family regulator
MSGTLARLRRHFGDELLVRAGNRYDLTPLAADLLARTAGALTMVEEVFAGRADSDAGSGQREFRVIASDFGVAVLGPAVSRILRERGRPVSLRFERIGEEVITRPAQTLRAVDGVVLPHGYLTRTPHLDLFSEQWVCLISADNSDVGPTLSLEQLVEMPMVLAYDGPTAFIPAARQLAQLGVEPRVELVAEGFLALPYLIAGTNRVSIVQERLAHIVSASAPVRILACPFDALPIVEALWWHPDSERDPGHRWLRDVIAEAGRRVAFG